MTWRAIFSYENKLLGLLSFIFGLVLLDRMALSFLVPFLDKELHLNNVKIGLLSSAIALSWALSGYFVGRLSDRFGIRKQLLIAFVILFSLSSFISGLAGSFAFLLATRVCMGLTEGPVLPLVQSIVAGASSTKRRGFNMGFTQSFGGGIVGIFGPVIIISLALHFGWRKAFFVTAVPGLLLAVAAGFIRNQSVADRIKMRTSIGELIKHRNVLVSIAVSCCMMTWLSVQLTFLPKYLIAVRQFSPQAMSRMLTFFGIAAVCWGVLVPYFSDRFGRKPVLVISFLLGLIMPLSVIFASNSMINLSILIMIGAASSGCYSIVLATVPSESVPMSNIAQTMGLVMGIGELFGGFLGPVLAGWCADHFGMNMPFLIAAVATGLAALLSCLFIETAPLVRKNKQMLTTS